MQPLLIKRLQMRTCVDEFRAKKWRKIVLHCGAVTSSHHHQAQATLTLNELSPITQPPQIHCTHGMLSILKRKKHEDAMDQCLTA